MADKKLQYTIELIDNFTKQFQKTFSGINKDFEQLKRDIGNSQFKVFNEQDFDKQLSMFGKFKRNLSRQAKELGEEIRKPLTISDAVYQGAQIGIPGVALNKLRNAASDIEYGMANIKKVLPHSTADQINQMKADIDELTRKIPKTKADMIAAYQVAVQSLKNQDGSVAIEDVKEYITTIEQLSVAFDMNAQSTSRAMMFIKKNLSLDAQATRDFGDQVANMHHNFGNALVPDIIEATSRMSALGTMVGLTKEQMIALSTLSLESGTDVSRTANAVQRGMISRLGSLAGTKKGVSGLQALGIDPQEFDKIFQKDKFSAFIKLLEQVNRMSKSGTDVTKPLQNLIGLHYYDVVAQLSNKVGNLSKSYEELSQTTKWSGEASTGYAKILDTEHSKAIILGTAFENLKEVLGTALLPAIKSVEGGLSSTLYVVADIMKNIPLLTQIVGISTAAWLAFKTAILGVRVAVTLGFIPALSGLIPALTAIAAPLGMVAAGAAAIAAAGYGIKKAYDWATTTDNITQQTLAPSLNTQIGTQSLGMLGIKAGQISMPNNDFLQNIPKTLPIPKGSSVSPLSQSPFKFDAMGLQHQKGSLEILVRDDRVDVKQRSGNMPMNIKQNNNDKPWQDLIGTDYAY